jgi:hypothetical protein
VIITKEKRRAGPWKRKAERQPKLSFLCEGLIKLATMI